MAGQADTLMLQPRAARAVRGWRREIRMVFSEEVMLAGAF